MEQDTVPNHLGRHWRILCKDHASQRTALLLLSTFAAHVLGSGPCDSAVRGLSHTLQSSSYGAAVQRSAFSYGVTYLALRLLKDGSLRHPGRNHEGGDPAAQTAEVE